MGRPAVDLSRFNQLMTVGEVATALRCSPCTVRRMAYRGLLKRYQRAGGGPVFFQRADVARMITLKR